MPIKDPIERRKYYKRYYEANKEKRLETVSLSKRRKKDWYQAYKAQQSCAECGTDHPATIVFHHPDDNKAGEVADLIANRGWGKKRVLEEIQKCTPLCRNCYAILHWEERQEHSQPS